MDKRINLIGLAGRSGSGKDLVASIIEYLTFSKYSSSVDNYEQWLKKTSSNYSIYTIKKYADKLKDIICILIGCTRKDLENREFKETELSEEWWYFKVREDAGSKVRLSNYLDREDFSGFYDATLVKPTPRMLMQLVGTECGRQIVHPNLWVNALFSDYKPLYKGKGLDDSIVNVLIGDAYRHEACDNCSVTYYGYKRQNYCKKCIEDTNFQIYPNWIITDVRFPLNEGNGVLDRNGILIGINREFGLRYPEYAHLEVVGDPYIIPPTLKDENLELYKNLTHESEELMGDFEWCDYIIDNNGSLEDLISSVDEILNKINQKV